MSRLTNFLRKLRPGQGNARVLETFNLEQYGARNLDAYDLTKPYRMLAPTEVRAMALGLPLFFWSDLPIRLLAQLKPGPYAEDKASLAEWWGINDAEEAHDILHWLRLEGHRTEYQPRLKTESLHWHRQFEANPFLAKRPVTNIGGWDYVRLVCVARWCYDYGYLSWEQAWPFMDVGARLALRDFDSWESLAASFMAGRLMWMPENPNHGKMAANLKVLVESPTSPWRQIPWQPYPVPTA
ncbi:DUF1266 domain-containing protein [Hymenobacter actinosclerus]|uniref:DUF1266 domain-containing protein n=1 Tax=Hymenobacter actinosclerus TaxID=82805 RepID=A0A1I0FCT3_9BACT|nr:DUF1266 domain-containing protein [Hymenobacter actinosclerus]SET55161.1 Protein of unknown function [Hymenobacter actinosclerus]